MNERRREPRLRSYLAGRLVINNHNSTLDALVRNVSAHGARLVMPRTDVLPDRFDLSLPSRGRMHHAVLVWRDLNDAGVVFVDEEAGTDESGPSTAAPEGPRTRVA